MKRTCGQEIKIGNVQDLEVVDLSDANKNFKTNNNETSDMLQNNSEVGNTSILQEVEEVEEIWMRNDSAANDSNCDDVLENNSSQESQHGIKSSAVGCRNKSKEVRVKKGERVKIGRGNSCRALPHFQ